MSRFIGNLFPVWDAMRKFEYILLLSYTFYVYLYVYIFAKYILLVTASVKHSGQYLEANINTMFLL